MGCHFLLQGNPPNPGIEPGSPILQADSLLSEPPEKPRLPEVTDKKQVTNEFVLAAPLGMWDLPEPEIKPVSPALAGGFLTTGPPGKFHIPYY